MSQPGQNDREFLMLLGVLGDDVVEGTKIVVRERIEHGRMPHLVQRSLHRSPAFDDFAGELQDDAAVPVWTSSPTQPINESRHWPSPLPMRRAVLTVGHYHR